KAQIALIEYPAGKAGSYIIPDSVTSIGDYAFDRCASLTNVTIGDSVTNIGARAFADCTSLAAINVNIPNMTYSSEDGVLFNKSKTALIQCPAGKAGRYIIPYTVTNIGDSAFLDCTNLTNVTLPNSVTSIADYAFGVCYNLTNLTIGAGVTSIGYWAFS